MFLSLFVTDTTDNMSRLLSIYPELEDIVKDMNTYLIQAEERADKLEEEYKQEVARLKEEIEKLKQKN